MGLFRKKTKVQLTSLQSVATRAIYHNQVFPTIDFTVKVKDDDEARRSDITEVTISMTLWEAARITQELHNAVSAGQMVLPRKPLNVPWGEG